jgi:hypothetical protein
MSGPLSGAVVTVTGNEWQQQANQLNQFFGSIQVTPPNLSPCTFTPSGIPATEPGEMEGVIEDAATGTAIATFSGPLAFVSPAAVSLPVDVAALLEPASVINHALIVKIADNCGTGGGSAVGGGHFAVASFGLDAVGIS